MMPRAKKAPVNFIEVAVNELTAVVGWHLKPQRLQGLFTTVAHAPRQNSMRKPRNHQPQIAIMPLETITNDQLVNLQSVARNGRQKGVRKTHAAFLRLFLRTRRMVSRPALKLRAMARCDKRSCNALSIKACFSALMRRPGPSGVHVLQHSRHSKRCRPPSVKPKRTTASDPLQWGHP